MSRQSFEFRTRILANFVLHSSSSNYAGSATTVNLATVTIAVTIWSLKLMVKVVIFIAIIVIKITIQTAGMQAAGEEEGKAGIGQSG